MLWKRGWERGREYKYVCERKIEIKRTTRTTKRIVLSISLPLSVCIYTFYIVFNAHFHKYILPGNMVCTEKEYTHFTSVFRLNVWYLLVLCVYMYVSKAVKLPHTHSFLPCTKRENEQEEKGECQNSVVYYIGFIGLGLVWVFFCNVSECIRYSGKVKSSSVSLAAFSH